MTEKEYFIFEIDRKKYVLDNHLFHNWNESISDLHLVQFKSADTTFNFLFSSKETHFLDFSGEEGLSQFLIDSGVQQTKHEYLSYQVKPRDRIKFLIEGGSSELYLFGDRPGDHTLYMRVNDEVVFKHLVSDSLARRLDFNQTIERIARLKDKHRQKYLSLTQKNLADV